MQSDTQAVGPKVVILVVTLGLLASMVQQLYQLRNVTESLDPIVDGCFTAHLLSVVEYLGVGIGCDRQIVELLDEPFNEVLGQDVDHLVVLG